MNEQELQRRIEELEEELQRLRLDNERMRDAVFNDNKNPVEIRIAHTERAINTLERMAAVAWQAFVDFRGEMREGFRGTHERQDRTNGTLKRHEWQIAFASGGVAVISFVIGVFGVYLLARFG